LVSEADNDPYLSAWGRVITYAGLLPTDERAQRLFRNPTALMFALHWNEKVNREKFDTLGEMLGTRWTRNMVDGLFAEADVGRKAGKKPLEEVFIPLAVAIEPELQEQVKKMFGQKFGRGAPEWARRDDDFEDLFDSDRAAFAKFVQSNIMPHAPKDPYSNKTAWQKRAPRKVRRAERNLPSWITERYG